MTVSTTANRISYAGDGSTVAFAYPYYFLANGDLVVLLVDADGDETVKMLTTHYTVSGAGDEAGGSITMLTAPASGETLVIYRDPTLTQDADYEALDLFPAETHERALDRGIMIQQRTREMVAQSLRVPEAEASIARLPSLTDRASKYAYFNADGELTASNLPSALTGATIYATRAQAAAAVTSSVLRFFVAGDAAAGDGHFGLYEQVGSEPGHSNKVEGTDGTWFELAPLDPLLLEGVAAYGVSLLAVASEAALKALINLEIGTDVQAYHARLADIAAASWAQGDLAYFNGSNLVRLAKGTANQSLRMNSGATAPEWGKAAGQEFIARAVAGGESEIVFTGFDAARYDAYLFTVANLIPSTDGANLIFRTSATGGAPYDSGASDYAYTRLSTSTAASSAAGSTGATHIELVPIVGSAANEDGVSGQLWMPGPHLSKATRINGDFVSITNAGAILSYTTRGERKSQAAVTAVRFAFDAGNVASGLITMAGLRAA